MGDQITPADASDKKPRSARAGRLRMPGGRNASPWSRRLVLGVVVVVVLLAPLWIDPLTLATIRGSHETPAPLAQDSIEPLDTRPNATDDPSLVWTVLGRDSFERSVATGWGTAELGGIWQSFGATAPSRVADGAALTQAGEAALSLMDLSGTTAHNMDVTFSVTVPAVPASTELLAGAVLRATNNGVGYVAGALVAADGTVSVSIEMFDATGARALVLPVVVDQVSGLAGTVLRVRGQATGIDPVTLKVRAWPAAVPEPGYWQQSVVDWTGVLQHDGQPGIAWALEPDTASVGAVQLTFDDFAAASADAGAKQ